MKDPFLKLVIELSIDGSVSVEKSGMDNELGVLGLMEKAKDIIKADYVAKKTLIQPANGLRVVS